MEPTEKDIVIEKIREMPEEQVKKLLIFIAGLEAGNEIFQKSASAGRDGNRVQGYRTEIGRCPAGQQT